MKQAATFMLVILLATVAVTNMAHAGTPGDFAPSDCDVDGGDLAALIANPGLLDIANFSQHFGKSDACSTFGIKFLGSANGESYPRLAVDDSRNIYVAGPTNGGLDGNAYAGAMDAYVIKCDPYGNKIWTRQIGSSSDDVATAILVDTAGHVYVSGYTSGNLDGNANAGDMDIFLVKYDSAGNRLWTKSYGTSGSDHPGYRMAFDSNGHIYMAGSTTGGLNGNINAGGNDVFVMKLDTPGNVLATKQFGTSGNDMGVGIGLDFIGHLYVAGSTDGNLGGNTNAGGMDGFVVKMDSSRNILWTGLFGTPQPEGVNRMNVDQNGNVYVCGYTSGTFAGNASSGGNDIFVVKYDSAGNNALTKQMGSAATDYAQDVALDTANNIYLTGGTRGGLDGNTNEGLDDFFVIKMNPSGTPLWTRQLGTSANDLGKSMAMDTNGDVVITGDSSGNLGGAVNPGGADIFLLKYDSSGILQ